MSTPASTLLSSVFDELVLGHLRRAHIRARLALNHIDTAGVALRGGLIDGKTALTMISEAGLLGLITKVSS
jgi:hypothetical protein